MQSLSQSLSMIAAIFVLVAGCGLNVKPKDGKLPCSEGCPSGYVCRLDQHCWRTNSPTADSRPADDAGTGDLADTKPGHGEVGEGSDSTSSEVGTDLPLDVAMAVDTVNGIDAAKLEAGIPVDTGHLVDAGGAMPDVPLGIDGAGGAGGTGGAAVDTGGTGNTGGSGGVSTTPVVECAPLEQPANGSVDTQSRKPGSTAAYSCRSGYFLLNGKSILICQGDGRWSDVIPTCLPDCGPPPAPLSGKVEVTSTAVGTTATYTCPEGYTSVTPNISCLAAGTWSGPAPACILVNCGAPSDPPNGKVSTPLSTTYQATVSYSCLTGYTITGDPIRTCLANAEWSGTAPSCLPVDCRPLTNPINGKVTMNQGTTFGSIATYACSIGYALLGGTSERQCQADGNWSGTAPSCEINCGQPPIPTNGGVSLFNGTWENSIGNYYCCGDLQFAPAETTTTRCQANGKWSMTAAPTCMCWGTSCSSICN